MSQLLIFGERPGPRTDPSQALFPHTTTGAAAKLIGLLGVETEQYLRMTTRRNAYHDGSRELSLAEARAHVSEVMTKVFHESADIVKILWVGKECLRAAPQIYRHLRFLEVRYNSMLLPHTSGVNHWYNDPENTERARRILREFTSDCW